LKKKLYLNFFWSLNLPGSVKKKKKKKENATHLSSHPLPLLKPSQTHPKWTSFEKEWFKVSTDTRHYIQIKTKTDFISWLILSCYNQTFPCFNWAYEHPRGQPRCSYRPCPNPQSNHQPGIILHDSNSSSKHTTWKWRNILMEKNPASQNFPLPGIKMLTNRVISWKQLFDNRFVGRS
jgi:hypothetical protein